MTIFTIFSCDKKARSIIMLRKDEKMKVEYKDGKGKLLDENSIDRWRIDYVLGLLPRSLYTEISEIARSVRGFFGGLSEVRLRKHGASTLVIFGESYPLFARLGEGELESLVDKLSGGELYRHRDTIIEGYISAKHGVRVGVVGRLRYDGGTPVGVDEISALVFRIPRSDTDFGDSLYRTWCESGRGNMLVASSPMGGKTTALRAFARYVSEGSCARVVVVDKRGEFDYNDYTGGTVDILSGYHRRRGVELAVSTLSPEVLIVDEIGSIDEIEALNLAISSGVTVISGLHLGNPFNLDAHPLGEALLRGFDMIAALRFVDGRLTFSLRSLD